MNSAPIQLTVLGSGTSMGVPTLGCHCPVCDSADPFDKRLRPSILLSRNGQNVVIDTTPDFRTQALRAGLDRLDALLLTHGHADHIMGFDDVRPFNLRQRIALPVYSNEETFRVLRRAFSYVFDDAPRLSAVPSVSLRVIDGPFDLLGVTFVPIPLIHGEMEVLGFRFGKAAYLTDFSRVPDTSRALLQDLDDLIVDALRDVPHPMHQTVEQALALIETIKPRRAWFTHIAHELPHAATNERLRKLGFNNIQMAYDGLQFLVAVDKPVISLPTTAVPTLVDQPGSASVFASSKEWAARYGRSGRGSVLVVGNFDGIHLGHQMILNHAVQHARESGAVPTALTFEPPPLKVLRPESAPLRLSTNQQRLEWFALEEMEATVVLPFTQELSQLSAEEFVEQILVRDLQARSVVVGENFRFGHKQKGNVTLLRELGLRHGFEVVIQAPVIYKKEIISSTLIRKLIADGDVTKAARLLGRPFVLTGQVVGGTGTGRRFTFPTLNLSPEQELLPGRGVYITRTLLDGESSSHRSVTNVGMRPTFNGSALSVETHLLDYSGNFTPERIEVRFWKRLRDEKKFNGADELRLQIARDIAKANRFFSMLRRFRSLRHPV
ncbi:MAG TPA: bifunctional riboflavin kinase/FAD synthetase [Candidatus Dormibacteraeota bacterium]|nr:bifunctional riboflavin kinase/FAD synthetase [Candidatus Dormibacteraeota bacterium]